jgi:hypothetical protein
MQKPQKDANIILLWFKKQIPYVLAGFPICRYWHFQIIIKLLITENLKLPQVRQAKRL